jgi:hypothetical protein
VHALTAAAAEAAGISAATAAQQENVQPEGADLDSTTAAAAAAAADANGQCSDDQHAGLEAVSGFVDAQQQAALDASTTAAAAVQLLREDTTQQQQQQQQQGEEAGEASSSHLPYQLEHYPHQQQQRQQGGLPTEQQQQQQQHLQDALQEQQGVSSLDTAHAAAAAGGADGAWTEAADDAAWAEPLATAHSAALSDLPISRESSAVSAAADDHDHHHQQQQREWVPWAEFVEVREKLRSKLDRGKAQFDELKGLHRKGKAEARALKEEVSHELKSKRQALQAQTTPYTLQGVLCLCKRAYFHCCIERSCAASWSAARRNLTSCKFCSGKGRLRRGGYEMR